MVTSPEISTESGFSLSGNYYLSIVVKENKTKVCFPLRSQNSLFCFELDGLIDQHRIGHHPWFGYDDGSNVIVPPDRPGFIIRKSSPAYTGQPTAFSKIFWKLQQTVKSVKTHWSEIPVLYSEFGSASPAIAFLEASGDLFVSVGDTPDRSILSAIHISRAGRETIRKESAEFAKRFSFLPNEWLKQNAFLSLFYSNSRCVDHENSCIMASKSPEYYVSSGFWSRDFVLWSLPLIELLDPPRSRELIHVLLTEYWKNRGTHALYLDGRILYEGFELDELAAYLIALSKGVRLGIVGTENAEKRVAEILADLESKRSSSAVLYRTDLNSSDDPVVYPYVTYDNVLLWHSLRMMADSIPGTRSGVDLSKLAEGLRSDIMSKLVSPEKRMFCYSSDLNGNFEYYDDPTGSLLLLPSLGFISANDGRMIATARWIKSSSNRYLKNGRFGGVSNRHVAHPWVHHSANLLLAGDRDGLRIAEAPLDNRFACETIDELTGSCLTGIHFPGSAGFLVSSFLSFANAGGASRNPIRKKRERRS